MKLSDDVRTDKKVQLTSWKSPFDPSIGSFSVLSWDWSFKHSWSFYLEHPHWRSGPWNGRIFIGVPNMNSANGDGFNFVVDNEEGRNNISFPIANDPFSIFVLNSQGKLVKTNRVDGETDWGVTNFISRNRVQCLWQVCGEWKIQLRGKNQFAAAWKVLSQNVEE